MLWEFAGQRPPSAPGGLDPWREARDCDTIPRMNISISRKQFVGGFAAAFGGLVLPADAFGTGTPILKFGLVSDVHLGGEGKDADLERVLRFFDAAFVSDGHARGNIVE